MERNILQGLIVTELIKHGWEVAPEDISHVVIAQKSVKTFKGIDFAKIHPIIVFENGVVGVKAEFVSKGQNALALCSTYIKTQDEIPVKIADFHEDIMKGLSQAFSVRMASPSKADKQKGMER